MDFSIFIGNTTVFEDQTRREILSRQEGKFKFVTKSNIQHIPTCSSFQCVYDYSCHVERGTSTSTQTSMTYTKYKKENGCRTVLMLMFFSVETRNPSLNWWTNEGLVWNLRDLSGDLWLNRSISILVLDHSYRADCILRRFGELLRTFQNYLVTVDFRLKWLTMRIKKLINSWNTVFGWIVDQISSYLPYYQHESGKYINSSHPCSDIN